MSAKRTLTSDLSDINSGVATARVPGDEQSIRERAARQRDAWVYLNRRYPPEQAAELADILGLTPQSRAPGRCACGAVLPMMAAVAGRGGYLNGRCTHCSRHDVSVRATPARTTPGACTIPQPAASATGWCRACDRTYRLYADRRLRRHPAWETRDGARFRLPWDCDGSGLRPEDLEGL